MSGIEVALGSHIDVSGRDVLPERKLSMSELRDLFDSGKISNEQTIDYVERLRWSARTGNESLHHMIVGMKSASIAGHNKGAETGMTWLDNYLFGPGLLPTEEELEMGAQAFCDKNNGA